MESATQIQGKNELRTVEQPFAIRHNGQKATAWFKSDYMKLHNINEYRFESLVASGKIAMVRIGNRKFHCLLVVELGVEKPPISFDKIGDDNNFFELKIGMWFYKVAFFDDYAKAHNLCKQTIQQRIYKGWKEQYTNCVEIPRQNGKKKPNKINKTLLILVDED